MARAALLLALALQGQIAPPPGPEPVPPPAPAIIDQPKKKCLCSPECVCGCNSGHPCGCKVVEYPNLPEVVGGGHSAIVPQLRMGPPVFQGSLVPILATPTPQVFPSQSAGGGC